VNEITLITSKKRFLWKLLGPERNINRKNLDLCGKSTMVKSKNLQWVEHARHEEANKCIRNFADETSLKSILLLFLLLLLLLLL
jgi:hypothetical protein